MKALQLWRMLLFLVLLLPTLAWSWEITGVPKEILSNLDNVLIAEAADCSPDVTKATLFSDSLDDRLQAAIKPFGYFHAEIIVTNADLVASCKDLLIEVKLNQATLISGLTIELLGEGRTDVLLKKLTVDGTVQLTEILGQWFGYVGQKCTQVAAQKANISEDAALLGCEVSEIAGLATEMQSCLRGKSVSPYCTFKE